MKKIIAILLLMVLLQGVKAQQDAQFSQYMFNGIYINPAYAGYKEQLNLHTFYRNQWTGIKGSPKSFSLAVDASAKDNNVGLAFQVATDRLGAQSSTTAYANYAYRLRLNDFENDRLSFGIGLGVVQNRIDGTLLNPIDLADQKIAGGLEKNVLPDARVGVFYTTDNWYAGFSVDNLIAQYTVKSENTTTYLPVQKAHYYLTAGVLIPINTDAKLKPSFLLKDDRGGPTSLDLNAFVLLKDKIWLGGGYRTAVKLYNKPYLQRDLQMKNSVIAMTEIFATPQLRIGYAFDYSLSKLGGYSGTSHEISVGFYLRRNVILMPFKCF